MHHSSINSSNTGHHSLSSTQARSSPSLSNTQAHSRHTKDRSPRNMGRQLPRPCPRGSSRFSFERSSRLESILKVFLHMFRYVRLLRKDQPQTRATEWCVCRLCPKIGHISLTLLFHVSEWACASHLFIISIEMMYVRKKDSETSKLDYAHQKTYFQSVSLHSSHWDQWKAKKL